MGLEGTVREDFKGLLPGKTLDFFLVGNGKPLWDSQILNFDAAVCLADFAIRTKFRLPSTFQDTSITPYSISCGATQSAPAIVSLYRPPSFYSCVSSHLLWRGLPPGSSSSSPYSLCNSLFCACLHLLLGRHHSTILPWVQRAIGAQVSAEIGNCFKFFVKKKIAFFYQQTTEDEMAGWHHRLNGCEFEWTPGVGDGQGGLACCDSWGLKESDTTERLNWTELNWSKVQKLAWFFVFFFACKKASVSA